MNNIKYFHQLTDEEFENLIKEGITYGELSKRHPQPEWCDYPDALYGEMGCWSLVVRRWVKNEEYCKDCELYNRKGE